MLSPALKLLALLLDLRLRRLVLLFEDAKLLMLEDELTLDGAAFVRY